MKSIFLVAACLLISAGGYAQGCSDAGFCSLGILKNNVESLSGHTLTFGGNYGLGEEQTNTFNPYLEYSARFNDQFSFSGKLTATYASGFLGSAFDIGDLYGSITYTPKINPDNALRFIGGVKVPLTNSDEKNSDGKPLPLDYQSSIGTYDVIAGVNYIIHKKWEFDAGVQIPVYQVDKNTFFPDDYTDPRAEKFPPTNDFRRESDVLGRVGYYINLPDSWVLKPNLLLLYHLGEDSYEDNFGSRQAIDGSRGFTLNAALTAVKTFKNKNSLEVILASPIFSRKVRPDGLTRDLVINLQYSIAL
jgi:hypothetical protein